MYFLPSSSGRRVIGVGKAGYRLERGEGAEWTSVQDVVAAAVAAAELVVIYGPGKRATRCNRMFLRATTCFL